MENQLQVSNTHQSNIALNEKEVSIAKIIYHVNQLIQYPLTATQIEDWSKSINELYPELNLDVLKNVIVDMKLDKIDWDHKKGIQNITAALRDIGVEDINTKEFKRKFLEHHS